MAHPERFFSLWALALHVVYALFPHIVPSTFLIACIVWVGSILHNLFINQQYSFIFDVILHHLPLAAFVYLHYTGVKPSPLVIDRTTVAFTLSTILIYLVVNGGLQQIWDYYQDHMKAFQGQNYV